MGDLREHYDELLHRLEELGGWRTNRARPPVLILGDFEGVETGIRQLRRAAPLQTETIAGITVPTLPEMIRVKAWLVVTRNAVRDHVDLCALASTSGTAYVQALSQLDQLYPQDSGESVLRQLCKQLADPRPYDLGEAQRQLAQYRGVQPPWQDWEHARAVSRDMAHILARLIGLDTGSGRQPGRSIQLRAAMEHRHILPGFEDTVPAVEDVPERGTVDDWRALAQPVVADPYGSAVRSLRPSSTTWRCRARRRCGATS